MSKFKLSWLGLPLTALVVHGILSGGDKAKPKTQPVAQADIIQAAASGVIAEPEITYYQWAVDNELGNFSDLIAAEVLARLDQGVTKAQVQNAISQMEGEPITLDSTIRRIYLWRTLQTLTDELDKPTINRLSQTTVENYRDEIEYQPK